jgi:hypothetical protein
MEWTEKEAILAYIKVFWCSPRGDKFHICLAKSLLSPKAINSENLGSVFRKEDVEHIQGNIYFPPFLL